MSSPGSSRFTFPRSLAAGVFLLCAPVVASSCGGAGTRNAAPTNTDAGANTGSGASGASGHEGASAGAGGKVGAGGSNAGTSAGGNDPAGGREPAADAGAGGSAAAGNAGDGAGGVAERPLGITCGVVTCAIGQACMFCVTEALSERRCVPHPESDPSGYAAAIEDCAPQPSDVFDDCDGPEDCGSNQFCVARAGEDGFVRCRDVPSTEHFCCFDCSALADCTICRNDQDCPESESCSRTINEDFKGCVP